MVARQTEGEQVATATLPGWIDPNSRAATQVVDGRVSADNGGEIRTRERGRKVLSDATFGGEDEAVPRSREFERFCGDTATLFRQKLQRR